MTPRTRQHALGLLARVCSRPLELRDRPRECDAIVVLGAPLLPSGELSPVCKERMEDAVTLWRDGIAPRILITGGAVRGHKEAPAMASYARELGVPEDCILVEDQSRSTAENARLTAALLEKEGWQRVWLVSQPFHLRRGRHLFRKQGLDAFARANEQSLQYAEPRRALKWIAREYLAWLAQLSGRRRV